MVVLTQNTKRNSTQQIYNAIKLNIKYVLN